MMANSLRRWRGGPPIRKSKRQLRIRPREERRMKTTIEFYCGDTDRMISSVGSSMVPPVGSCINIQKKTWKVARVTYALDYPDEPHSDRVMRANVSLFPAKRADTLTDYMRSLLLNQEDVPPEFAAVLEDHAAELTDPPSSHPRVTGKFEDKEEME
jgi:hypothetical protein